MQKNRKTIQDKTEEKVQANLKNALIFENVYDDGENFWFTEFDYNALCKVNKKSQKVELIGIFPGENFVQESLYISTVVCGKKMYFAPYSAHQIAVYDLEKNIFSKIKVDIPCKDKHLEWEKEKFLNIVSAQDKIYFIPYHYPGILCYEIKSDKCTCFDDWVDIVEKKRTSKWGYFMDFELDGNNLILPCSCADAVVIFDIILQKSRVIFTPHTENQCKYCGICHVNNFFYLISADGAVVKRRLEKEDEEIKKIKLPIVESEEINFYPIQYMNGYIYMFPYRNNQGIKIDTQTDCVSEEDLFNYKIRFEGHTSSYLSCIAVNENLYATSINRRCLIQFDLVKRKKHEVRLFLSKADQDIIQRTKKQELQRKISGEYVTENMADALIFLMDILEQGNDLRTKESKIKNGDKIYSTLKKGIGAKKYES